MYVCFFSKRSKKDLVRAKFTCSLFKKNKRKYVPQPLRSPPYLSGNFGPGLQCAPGQGRFQKDPSHAGPCALPLARSPDFFPQRQLPRYFASSQSAPPSLIGSPRSGRPMRMTCSGARRYRGQRKEVDRNPRRPEREDGSARCVAWAARPQTLVVVITAQCMWVLETRSGHYESCVGKASGVREGQP